MLYVVGPNGGSIEMVDPSTGEITRIVDVSATYGHVVPTSLAFASDGTIFFVNLGRFPIVAGQSSIYMVTADGTISEFATGLTAELGIAIDAAGNLYVLETSGAASGPAPFTPGSGRVVHVEAGGGQEVIVEGLFQPTALRFGPDGNLYVTNNGWASPPGSGQILRIELAALPATPPAQATPVG
jgi:sugar lactone lactonase YvrE